MVTEPKPSGEPQSAVPEIDTIWARPDVQARHLAAVVAASDALERDLKAEHATKTSEWEKVKTGWAKERRENATALAAFTQSQDADTLKSAMLDAEAKVTASMERDQASQMRERRAEVREIIADLKDAHKGLPKEFWDKASERLMKGEVRSHVIGLEALNYAAPAKEPAQPTGLQQGGGGGGVLTWEQATKSKTPISAADYVRLVGTT